MAYKLIVKNAKVILKTVTNAVLNITGIKDLLTGTGSVDSNNKINWTLQEYTNTAANFTSTNPVLLLGQKGIETDGLLTTPKFKIGDGITAWNSLPYFSSSGGSGVQSVSGTTVDNTDPLNPVVNIPTLQEVTDIDGTTTNPISILDGLGNACVDMGEDYLIVNKSDLSGELLNVDRLTDTVSLGGVLNEAKWADIASAGTTNIGGANGNYGDVTGNVTITALGTAQAGATRTATFTGAPLITYNPTSLLLPGNVSIQAGAGDVAIFKSLGSGNWKCISYVKYDESYTNYTPTFTGFSVNPTINAGDARWKMISKNTCHVIIWATTQGTSNANTMTVTLPFTAAWSGGSGFGLQQNVMGVQNNGTNVNGSVRTRVSGSNILDCYNGIVGATFTASGSKGVFLNFIYQIEI